MSGLFTFAIAGLGFILIGAFESLSPFLSHPATTTAAAANSFRFLSAAALSSIAVLNSLFSSVAALRTPPRHHDPLALPIHLDSLAAASLFLLYALAGFLSTRPRTRLLLPLPSSALDLVLLFAFAQELLLFSLFQRKDPAGIENRYYDLLLVPVLVCAAATVLCAARPGSAAPRLARGLGLVLQGTWFVQMGFSFFSSAVAHGCALHERSRGNFTLKCSGHPEYHRARAIATLQFNCHLALLVAVAAGVYSAVVTGHQGGGRYQNYKPLREMQRMDHPSSQFTLESDEEGVEEAEGHRSKQQDVILPVSGVNGFGETH